MEMQKPKRSENFTLHEKDFIIQLVKENPIIESKDTTSIKRKQKAWQKLTHSFNSNFATNRTTAQLKLMWKYLKTTTKKSIAQGKRESIKTGGGTNKAPVLTAQQEVIKDIIAKDLETIRSPYDDDAISETNNSEGEINSEGENNSEGGTVSISLEQSRSTSTPKRQKTNDISAQLLQLEQEKLDVMKAQLDAQERIAGVLERMETNRDPQYSSFLQHLGADV